MRRERDRDMILGIETSCDETAAAVVHADGSVLSSIVASQAELHARYGGVVPEVASRRHLELVGPGRAGGPRRGSVDAGRHRAHRRDAGPGLIGALLVGLSAAKAIAWSRGLPLVAVDHLQGHVASLYLGRRRSSPRSSACSRAAATRCCSPCGERGTFERLGTHARRRRRRGLRQGRAAPRAPLPRAAPRSTRLARDGDPEAFAFPVARVPGLDFSFSGVKTSLLYAVRDLGRTRLAARRADLAASYQRAIVRALTPAPAAGSRSRGNRADRRRRRRRGQLRAPRGAARTRLLRHSRSARTTPP